MARMPSAVWQGEHSPGRRMERYDIVCIHTIVGYAPAHAAHFSVKGNGTIIQSRDTAYQSGANLNGNHRVIAIENEDHGPQFPRWTGSDVPPLTPEQVESNAQILAWAHQTHGIPLQLCPDSKPGSRGLAYHRQGIDGNFATYRFPGRVRGGEVWTEHYGKVCPGDRRIAQRRAILKRAREIVNAGRGQVLRVATWNVGSDNGVLRALTDLLREEKADILGLQEVGDRTGVLERVVLRTGATLVHDPLNGGGRGKCALLVREGLPVVASDWIACTPRTPVGRFGAGPSTIDAKWIVSAKVHLPDVERVLNTGVSHKVSSVQRPPFPGRKKRRRIFEAHTEAEVAWVKSLRGHGAVVLLEDANATPRFRLLDPLDAAGMECFTAPSHGRRAIDHVRVLDQRKTEVLDVEALDGFPGDHRPVIADLLVTPNLRRL